MGTQSVIITTKPGYRQAVRDSLSAHGDRVIGEFPALNAITAEVHCEDLVVLPSSAATTSISVNARVAAQQLLSSEPTASIQVQQTLTTAKSGVIAAATKAAVAQQTMRTAERSAALAKAQVAAAQKAVADAGKLSEPTRSAALSAAYSQLMSARAVSRAAQDLLAATRKAAITVDAANNAAAARLVEAQEALQAARALAAREREGEAAERLNRRFFATVPVRNESAHMGDAQFDELTGEANISDVFFSSALGGAAPGNIGVAVIDSGIAPGTDFDDRIAAFFDFTQGDIRAVAPNDAYGHGTHVAGLIASEFIGVAPGARLIGLKVLDEKGQGTTDNVVRAIEFAIANKHLLGINVLNISLGHPIYEPAATDPLVQAVEHAARAGLVVLVAAGNFGVNPTTGQPGYAGIASPANSPSCIAVGAARTFNTVTRLDDRVAPYSSRGPSWYDGFAKPDVIAPGDNLLSIAAAGSTLRLAQEQRGNTGSYMRLSGTSMAAGVASGVAALVLDNNPHLTPNTVKAILEYTAIPVNDDTGALYDPLSQGTGQIQATGAVMLARAINPGASAGSPWLSSSFAPSTLIGGRFYTWSQSILWGNRRVIGTQLLNEQRPAWALNIVWGEGVGAEDDNIVWGNNFGDDDNIVWGNSFDAGDNIVWGNNVVWGNSLGDDDNIVWGNLLDDNIVWGNLFGNDDNIVWGNNVVWGSGLIGMSLDDNIVWGNMEDDNIVWGNLDDDNIVWGNLYDDNIVWGNSDDDDILWGNLFTSDDNIVWGNTAQLGQVIRWTGGVVAGKASDSRARRTLQRKAGVL